MIMFVNEQVCPQAVSGVQHGMPVGSFMQDAQLKKNYWGIVDLQCCVNFCCIAK